MALIIYKHKLLFLSWITTHKYLNDYIIFYPMRDYKLGGVIFLRFVLYHLTPHFLLFSFSISSFDDVDL